MPQATKVDWVLVALPTTLSIKTFYAGASEQLQLLVMGVFAIVNGLLVARVLLRPVENRYGTQFGPLILLFVSSAIILTRPTGFQNVVVFLLVGILAIRLPQTTDARRIIASLTDGLGVYALVNVLAYGVGLRSPSLGARLGVGDRIIFPLAQSVNLPPILAATYLSAGFFLFREPGVFRRTARTIFFIASTFVLLGSGSRMPVAIAATLVLVAFARPAFMRSIATVSVIISAISAFILPKFLELTEFLVSPIASAIRSDSYSSISALNGRDYIWDKSLNFWKDEVTSPVNVLFGYGLQGHYTSGLSRSYYDLWNKTARFDPLKSATTHNSFLEQLFDGGVVGWLLLLVALVWVARRIAGRLTTLGNYGVAALMFISAITLTASTEVVLAPNASLIPFWVLVILVGAGCQTGHAEDSQANAPR